MSNQGNHARIWTRGEPPLDDLLADHICRLMMTRDGISLQAMAALVDRVRANIGASCP